MRRRRVAGRVVLLGLLLGVLLPELVGGAAPAGAAGTTVTDQRIGVLPVFFPSERDFVGSTRPMWNRLATAGSDVGLVVIVENTIPSIDYKDFVEREQGVGQIVLGMLGAQSDAGMLASASFQRTHFGIDGVLLRGYDGTCAGNQPNGPLISGLRGLGLSTIAVETGATPGSCYQSIADILLTYTGSYASYTSPSSPPAIPGWLTGASPKLWHAVFAVPQAQIATIVAASKAAGADYVFTTADSGPFEATAIPDQGYWDTLRTAVRGVMTASSEVFPSAGRQTMGVPLFGTANASWEMVGAAPTAQLGYIVANASNGPGTSQDSTLLAKITAAKQAGRKVLGYVPLGYTPTGGFQGSPPARSDVAILDDVTKWRDYYGVNGVFLDEVQPECTVPGHGDIGAKYASLAASMRSIIPGGFLVLNPGRNIGECFAAAFDAIVAFEGPASAYPSWTPSRWQDRWPDKQFWHLVHGSASGSVASLVTLSKCRNADVIYLTEQSGGGLWLDPVDSGYFTTLRSAVSATTRCASSGTASAPTAPRAPSPGSAAAPGGTRAAAPAATPNTDAGLVIKLEAPVPSEPMADPVRVADPPAAPVLRHAQVPPGNASPSDIIAAPPGRVPVRVGAPVTVTG